MKIDIEVVFERGWWLFKKRIAEVAELEIDNSAVLWSKIAQTGKNIVVTIGSIAVMRIAEYRNGKEDRTNTLTFENARLISGSVRPKKLK